MLFIYHYLSQFISKMDLSPPPQNGMGFWASPISMWNDWQGIQGFDLEIWMCTNSPPLYACCAEIVWHHGEYNAVMQCLLNQQSLHYQIYNFVQNSWNIYSIFFRVAGGSLKYSPKLVFRKLQLEYNGTHLEIYTSNSIPCNVFTDVITYMKTWFFKKHTV